MTDFIDDIAIGQTLESARTPSADPVRVREILAKSLAVQTLDLAETATLLQVADPGLRLEMEETALKIKRFVYDNRIVTFAPMYVSNRCVNRCKYCGFSADNPRQKRRTLTMPEIKAETEAMAGRDGHKRVMAVFGEHPSTGAEYIADTLGAIYSADVPTRRGRAGWSRSMAGWCAARRRLPPSSRCPG